ncbi:MAG: carbohydrate kinase family protein [Saprospiraceae bacterium]
MTNAVCFGEVLWDLLPSGKVAGGAPMNVAFHLQQLGIATRMISRIGKDALGEALLDFLQQKNVATDFIQQDDHYATGVVNVTFSDRNEPIYTIEQPVAWDFIRNSPPIVELVKNAAVFVHGSLIARSTTSCQTLLALIEAAPVRVFDVNLRTPFYSKELIKTLLPNTNLLKMNEDEAELLCEWFAGGTNWKDRLPKLQEQYNIDAVLVTLGKAGAQLTQAGETFTQSGFPIKVQDTIGSGDAFLAGFLSQWLQQRAPQTCLQFACAMGALIATHRGALPTVTINDVEKMIAGESNILQQ